jgi:hypothetical protein
MAGNPTNLQANAYSALICVQGRFEQDTALVLLTTHYAQGLMAVLLVLPPQTHTSTIQSVIVQTIQDWEDIHRKFEDQLKPAA